MAPTARGKVKPPLGEMGFAFDGVVDADGLVPESHLPDVFQIEGMFLDDCQIVAMSNALTLPIRRNGFDIEEPKDAKPQTELLRDNLLSSERSGSGVNMMQRVVAQMCTGVDYGKAFFELVVSEDGDNWVYDDIAFRPPKTCRVKLDKNGRFAGFRQYGGWNSLIPYGPFDIPLEKSFVYLHNGHIDPGNGKSAFIAAYNRWQHKKKVESLLFQHLMRTAGGIKVAKYEGAVSGDEAKDAVQSVFNRAKTARGQGTIGLGPDESLDILGLHDASAEFREVLLYLNSEMARSVLAQFLMLGTQSGTGSWALSKDHSDFFLMALEAIMREMEISITNQVIAPLVRWNFGDKAIIPRFRFETMAETTRILAHETWANFVGGGILPMNASIGRAMEELARQAMDIPPESVDIPSEPPELPTPPWQAAVEQAQAEQAQAQQNNNARSSVKGNPSDYPPSRENSGKRLKPSNTAPAARARQDNFFRPTRIGVPLEEEPGLEGEEE